MSNGATPQKCLTIGDRWREVCAQLRATDDISFKLLGFVPLFTVATIAAVLFKSDHRFSLGLVIASLVGALTTLGFWIWERRNIQICNWLRERAADIERASLGEGHVGQFSRLSDAPHGWGKTEGEKIVYGTTISAWLCVPLLAASDMLSNAHCALQALYGAGSLIVAVLAWREIAPPITTVPRGKKKERFMEGRVINPWPWTEHYGVAQGVEISGASRTVICSGQISVDADGQPLHVGDMKAQVQRALDNLETVLRRADMTFSDVVRLNAYTTDMDAFLAELVEDGALFTRLKEAKCCPVLTGVGVTRLAFSGLTIEIEATAMK